MINSLSLKKLRPSWKWFQNTVLTLVTIIFWYGVFVWLKDGAWENGAFPTHGVQHMTIGFLGCWCCYFILLWLKQNNKQK